jgi:hypothetical protein
VGEERGRGQPLELVAGSVAQGHRLEPPVALPVDHLDAQPDVVEPEVAEGVEPIRDSEGRVVGWRRNVYSYPPIGTPDSGAYVTVADLIAFHRALVSGRLLGRELTAAALTPRQHWGQRAAAALAIVPGGQRCTRRTLKLAAQVAQKGLECRLDAWITFADVRASLPSNTVARGGIRSAKGKGGTTW